MTRTRLITAVIMTPLAIAAILLLPTPWMVALTALLLLAVLWEWFRLAGIDDTLQRLLLLLANLALMVALAWASHTRHGGSPALFQATILLGLLWWGLATLWLRAYDFGLHTTALARMAKLAAATLAVVPAWAALALLHAESPHGPRWLLTALAIVWAADSGAYFAGSHWGRRKLSPRISPNKTVEGLLGGIVAGVLTGLALALFAGASLHALPAVALAALLTVAAAVVGDLFESLLKRHAGAKDSGDLLPGHGGMLDRLDSVLAALPVFVVAKSVFGF
jgi:phosphatidate cytidylyltransferase